MQKTPDEIKKGLECCSAHGRCRSTDCKSCPFRWKTPGCEFRMHRQALALLRHRERENAQQAETIERLNDGCHKLLVKIQQLEKDKADLLEERELNDFLRDKVKQLKAERDAAVENIRGDCVYCLHLCEDMVSPSCFDCANKGYYRWEWRGVQKEG